MMNRMHTFVDPWDVQCAVYPIEMEGLYNRQQREKGQEPDWIALCRNHRCPSIGVSHPNDGIIERPDGHAR